MKESIKKNKELIVLIAFVAIAIFFMYYRSYSANSYFVNGRDVRAQWYQFYIINKRETINALRNGVFPFYSWVSFLGTNIWAANSYYGLFDIFNIFSYILPFNYFEIYDIQCFIKILMGAIFFYLLIEYIYKNKKVALVSGMCYGLSSFSLFFTAQPGFLSFYSIVPLYFLGIEKYLKEKKNILFIISTFLLILINYYLFFSLSFFSPIYFIYRYYNLNKSLNGLIKSSIKLVFYYLIAVLLAGAMLLPTVFYILDNERVGSMTGSFTYDDISMYLHLLVGAFLPSHTYIYGVDVFSRHEHALKEICLYAGSIIPVVNAQILLDKNKYFKRSTIVLYVVIALLLLIPYGSMAMHGFSEVSFRWTFLIIIINLIVLSKYLCELTKINKKLFIVHLIISILMIFGFFIFTLNYKNETLLNYYTQFITLIEVATFLVIDSFFILKNNLKLLTVFLFVELALFSYESNINYAFGGTRGNFVAARNVLASDKNYNELKCFLDSLDENNPNEFYRVYVPYESLYWSYSKNMNLLYNINGLMTYSSTYAPSFNKMKAIADENIVGFLPWDLNILESNLIDLYATKYSITTTEEEIPFESYRIIMKDYRISFIVAENLNYKSLGVTYGESMTYDEFFQDYGGNTKILLDYIVTDFDHIELTNGANQNINRNVLENIVYRNNQLYGTAHSDKDSLLLLSLPYDEGWKILVNKEQVRYFEANGGNICIPINSGENNIEMYFIPRGFKKGAIMSLVGFVLLCLQFCKRKRNRV